MLKCVVCLCKGSDGYCVFCLYCEVWSCRCSCIGSVSVSLCICCMFVSCVHYVAVLNAAFCMTCSLLMLVVDARDNHMTALWVVMSFSFCLPYPVALSDFIICRGLCGCSEML